MARLGACPGHRRPAPGGRGGGRGRARRHGGQCGRLRSGRRHRGWSRNHRAPRASPARARLRRRDDRGARPAGLLPRRDPAGDGVDRRSAARTLGGAPLGSRPGGHRCRGSRARGGRGGRGPTGFTGPARDTRGTHSEPAGGARRASAPAPTSARPIPPSVRERAQHPAPLLRRRLPADRRGGPLRALWRGQPRRDRPVRRRPRARPRLRRGRLGLPSLAPATRGRPHLCGDRGSPGAARLRRGLRLLRPCAEGDQRRPRAAHHGRRLHLPLRRPRAAPALPGLRAARPHRSRGRLAGRRRPGRQRLAGTRDRCPGRRLRGDRLSVEPDPGGRRPFRTVCRALRPRWSAAGARPHPL